jgi:hypothetical protein
MATPFTLLNWAARAPGRSAQADWCAWAGRTGAVAESAAAPELPMMLRRRLTPIGQAALAAAAEAGAPAEARYVFCSRHGEFVRTARLLTAVAQDEPLSPADFSVSVHNALAGILSIANGARAGHTAIAHGNDSFAAGLLEAVATLAADQATPVLLVYFDDDLPPPYDSLDAPAEGVLALAVLLGGDAADGEKLLLSFEPADAPMSCTPQAPALDFIRFLAAAEAERVIPGRASALRCARAR